MDENYRLPTVLSATGRSKSSHYADIKAGLFVPPVKVGPRAAAYPSDEVAAIRKARIAGKSEAEIRKLVSCLIAARGEGA